MKVGQRHSKKLFFQTQKTEDSTGESATLEDGFARKTD
jgi:hypothetical protein